MAELLGLRFFPSSLLLCCALHVDMYYETSKYWSSEARLLRFWTATWGCRGCHLSVVCRQSLLLVCSAKHYNNAKHGQLRTIKFFFGILYTYAMRCKQLFGC